MVVKSGVVTLSDALAQLPADKLEGGRYAEPLGHGTMRLGFYAPRGFDPQQPHEQDELYFVVAGSATFVHGGERSPCRAGDALFVAAGLEHRFEDLSDDFAAWVVFWGPPGGEVPEG